jgi:opacity protein-like surface antigen
MKLLQTISLAGVAMIAAATFAHAQTATQGFLRPTLGYAIPDADDYDNELTYSLAGGVTMGENEWSAEIGRASWDSGENMGNISIAAKEAYVPFLANYRRYFTLKDNKVRIYAGPSLGFTYAKYEIEFRGRTGNTVIYGKDDARDTLLTLAANVGADINLNEKMSINLGYRYLYLDEASITILGAKTEIDEFKAHVISAALNVRF